MEVIRYSLVTAPTVQPLSAQSVRDFLRIDHEADDNLIDTLISVATEDIRADMSDIELINATYDGYLDDFPKGDTIILRKHPLSSLTSVKYVDSDGNTQTVSSANYTVDSVSSHARIRLVDGESWPNAKDQNNAVTIRGVFGYGAASSNIPDAILLRLKAAITFLYENRGDMEAQWPSWVDRISDSARRHVAI